MSSCPLGLHVSSVLLVSKPRIHWRVTGRAQSPQTAGPASGAGRLPWTAAPGSEGRWGDGEPRPALELQNREEGEPSTSYSLSQGSCASLSGGRAGRAPPGCGGPALCGRPGPGAQPSPSGPGRPLSRGSAGAPKAPPSPGPLSSPSPWNAERRPRPARGARPPRGAPALSAPPGTGTRSPLTRKPFSRSALISASSCFRAAVKPRKSRYSRTSSSVRSAAAAMGAPQHRQLRPPTGGEGITRPCPALGGTTAPSMPCPPLPLLFPAPRPTPLARPARVYPAFWLGAAGRRLRADRPPATCGSCCLARAAEARWRGAGSGRRQFFDWSLVWLIDRAIERSQRLPARRLTAFPQPACPSRPQKEQQGRALLPLGCACGR